MFVIKDKKVNDMIIRLLLLIFVLNVFSVNAQKVLKVACVGNSITYGIGASSKDKCYVSTLGNLLGNGFNVGNFGQSGSTLCRKSYKPYCETKEFILAKEFLPDIVIIALGTNDSQPRVWDINDKSKLESDLKWLCNEFKNLDSNPSIYICLPPYVIDSPRWQHKETILSDEIIPVIKSVAKENEFKVIDLYSLLYKKNDCFKDNLHPNDLGHNLIAKRIKEVLTEK